MTTFIVIVVGPALGFMIYALSQFVREAIQLRRAQGHEVRKKMTVVTASGPVSHDGRNRAADERGEIGVPKKGPAVVRFASTGEEYQLVGSAPSEEKRNVIVFPLGTTAPEVKRAAKGSS